MIRVSGFTTIYLSAFLSCVVCSGSDQTQVSLELRGTVADGSGAPVEGATVVLRTPLEEKRVAATARDGAFVLRDLPRRHYQMWVAKEGYRVYHRTFELDSREDAEPLDVRLQTADSGEGLVPASEQAGFDEATLMLQEGEWRSALNVFMDFTRRYPYMIKAQFNVGLCLAAEAANNRHKGRYEIADQKEKLAQSRFRLVLQRYPDFAPALAAIVYSDVHLRQSGPAAEGFEKLLRLEPNNPVHWYTYGEVLIYLKQLDKARLAFLTAVELDPAFADAHAKLGALAMNEGDNEEAARRFELFIALAPDSNMAPSTRELLDKCKAEIGK